MSTGFASVGAMGRLGSGHWYGRALLGRRYFQLHFGLAYLQ